jgi:hypothetical protein
MSAISFIDLNVNNAEQFKESISEASANSKLYLTFGKIDAWANDLAPPQANSSVSTLLDVWSNMIGGKRLVGSDLVHAIPRNIWTANTSYFAYDDNSDQLFSETSKMVIVTSEYNVYKCIANNYGALSTVEPTSVNPLIVSTTSDGYYWKYLYTISDSDQLRFLSTNYIPVKTLTIDDGSTQWAVQDNAIDGAIHYIKVTAGGNNYTNASTITVSIAGDGADATATATINSISNTVNSIVVVTPGSDYSYATVTITDSGIGTGANARAIISPPGGHGLNPIYELGAKNIMINARLQYDEEDVLPVINDFRQIAILKDPIAKGTGEIMSNSAFAQVTTITTVGVGDYVGDEWVYQGASLATASYKGRVVSWDSVTGKVLLINIDGEPTAAQSLIGATSFTVRVVSSVTDEALTRYSGRLMYVDNIKPITRDPEQIESFKILLRF